MKLLKFLSLVIVGLLSAPGFVIGFSIRAGSNAADLLTSEIKRNA